MTPQELASQLRPIRLPVDYAEPTVLEAMTAFAIGLAVTLLLVAVARPFLARRTRPMDRLRQEIAALAQCERDERVIGLARIYARFDKGGERRPIQLSEALYRQSTPVDFPQLEADILAIAKGRKGEPL